MWSSVLLSDADELGPKNFSGVTVVPLDGPAALAGHVETAQPSWLIVVVPAALAERAAPALTLCAARWPQLRLARLDSPHAPLAMLSALALAHGVTDSPGLGLGLVDRLLAESWSGAWTHSLTRLNRPVPTLAQHARSLLPGAGFLVRQWPDPAVLSGRPADAVPAAAAERVLLLQEGAVPPALGKSLADLPGVRAVRQVEMPGRWTSVYGTPRTGQIALVPADPRPLVPPAAGSCPSCRLETTGPDCGFCRVASVTSRPRPTARAGRRPAETRPLAVPAEQALGVPAEQAADPRHAATPPAGLPARARALR